MPKMAWFHLFRGEYTRLEWERELELVHQHLKVHYPLKDCPPWTSRPSITELRQATRSWASTKCCWLHPYMFEPLFSLCPRCSVCRLDANSRIMSVRWHCSVAELWSSPREPAINQKEESLNLSERRRSQPNLLCIESSLTLSQVTAEMDADCSCRRRTAEGKTRRTCANWIFLAGGGLCGLIFSWS